MRDPELMLSLLREMAAQPDGRRAVYVALNMGEEARREVHHLEILTDAGHVEWSEPRKLPRITNAGYDFIEAADKNEQCMAKFLYLLGKGIPYLSAVKFAMELLTAG